MLRRLIAAAGVLAALGAGLVVASSPAQAGGSVPAATSTAIAPMNQLIPLPSIICGSSVCGNVRNVGSQAVLVNGSTVRPGQTSRQVGVVSATNVKTTSGQTGIHIWQWFANGGHPFQSYRGCYFVGRAVPLGHADYYVQSVNSCPLG